MLSSTDLFALLRWWLALVMMGTAVVPLTFMLFNKLADRGYAFTKMVGLLLVSYLFWIMGSLGFVGNNLGGIVLALLVVAGLSAWAFTRQRAQLTVWLRENVAYIGLVELLFLVMFVLWAFARAQHPEIANTEKPMEFAFLNAAVRTPTFPPIDPWLSGFAISYYYFGYVMMSVVTRLAAVPTAVGFNLALVWVVAATAVGSFGLVYNLIASRGREAWRTAVLFGFVAAFAIPLAGNQQITMEVLYANDALPDDFWRWLDVRDINDPPSSGTEMTPRYTTSAWWWWRASRPINEYTIGGTQSGLEPIVEFPAFSFILGDIHPHVLALPFALLSLALALVWFLESRALDLSDFRLTIGNLRFWERDNSPATEDVSSTVHNSQSALVEVERSIIQNLASLVPSWPLFAITVIILGGLSFLNTWDVLIHMFVVLAAFALGQWQRRDWSAEIGGQTAVLAVLIAVPAIILYFPFYLGFQSQTGAPYILPMLMRPTRLPHFLIIFGMPLLVVVVFLVGTAVRQRFQHGRVLLITAVGSILVLLMMSLLLAWIVASSAAGSGTVMGIAGELGVALPPRPEGALVPGWGLRAILTILPGYLAMRLRYPLTALLLATLLGFVIMLWSQYLSNKQTDQSANTAMTNPSFPFTLLLILTAVLLTLGPEFLYLRDNFGVRLNTVFKFYYQAWVMFGIAAVVALEVMWREWRSKIPAVATGLAYAALLASALQFPVYAVRSRAIEYRGALTAENRLPATLDGLAKLKQYNPDEYSAIMWLSENSNGLPVVLEATGGAYSTYGRVSANTGLPTVLGWANHEYQWRGSDTPEPGERAPAIEQIYRNPFWDNTGELLDRYDVAYIYVGNLERTTYGNGAQIPAQEKFDQLLNVAYQNNSVTIYRWQGDSEE